METRDVKKKNPQEETQGLLSLSSPPVLLLVPPSLTPTTQVSCCNNPFLSFVIVLSPRDPQQRVLMILLRWNTAT